MHFNIYVSKIIFSVISCVYIFGCSTKGYSGPDLESTEIANVSIHSDKATSIRKIEIDNNDLGIFSSSIDLLEGEHKFLIEYETEQIQSCYPEQQTCQVKVSIGSCKGNLKTFKNRNYMISISSQSLITSVSVLPKGYSDFNVREDEKNAGHGLCTEEYSRIMIKSERS